MNLSPLPTGAPSALADLRTAVAELLEPTQPGRLYPVASASLPPAADWTYSQAWATDLNALVVSNGTAWIRTDTGAAI